MLSQQLLDRIAVENDIVAVVSERMALTNNGYNYEALCPFHSEKSPSFNVNPYRQIFHCFGCHKGGDVFTFVKEYDKITFTEAVIKLAKRANIDL